LIQFTKIFFFFSIIVAFTNSFAQIKLPLSIQLKPYKKDALFHSDDDKIGFALKLKNEVKDIQRGNYYFDVRNDSGRSIFNDHNGFAINEHSSFSKDITLDKKQLNAGCYEVKIYIQTNYYKDTLKHFFCYNAEEVAFADSTKPTDFFQFWEEAKRELVNTNPLFRATKIDTLCDKFANVYLVQFQSTENNIIKGWLSVPKEYGKFPALYKLYDLKQPSYPDRQREAVTFSIDIRGSGMSTNAVALSSQDYFVLNADYKRRFILRGVYMDCLRGLDFLFRNDSAKIDNKKIVVMGFGQAAPMAVATVALDGRAAGLSLERPVGIDIPNFLQNDDALYRSAVGNTIRNYISNPNNKTNIFQFQQTWSYFDPIAFASLIRCKFLMGLTLRNDCPPKTAYHFINKLSIGRRDIYVCPECNNEMNSAFIELQKLWLHEIY
jgi:cephalosporin-C deacetylase